MPKKKLLIATGNPHKVRELQALLEPLEIEVVPPDAVGGLPEVPEDGTTFRDNAVAKAVSGRRRSGLPTLADDSGLEVFALDRRPGVWSSRYAGEEAGDEANLRKLLEEMAGVQDRSARFVCVLAVAYPGGSVETIEGEVRGRILDRPRGRGGFGYDPVFVPEGYDRTFAELPETVKNRLSHRGTALRRAIAAGLFARIPEVP